MWEDIEKLAQPGLYQEDSHASNPLADNYDERRLSEAISEFQAILDGRNNLMRPLQEGYRPDQEPLSSTIPIEKGKCNSEGLNLSLLSLIFIFLQLTLNIHQFKIQRKGPQQTLMLWQVQMAGKVWNQKACSSHPACKVRSLLWGK
jgi:hypothetical protein